MKLSEVTFSGTTIKTENIHQITNEDLIIRTVLDTVKAGIVSGTTISAKVLDIKNSFPLFSLDYLEKEKTLRKTACRFNNPVFAGKHGNDCNCLIPGAIKQELPAAKRIAERNTENQYCSQLF